MATGVHDALGAYTLALAMHSSPCTVIAMNSTATAASMMVERAMVLAQRGAVEELEATERGE